MPLIATHAAGPDVRAFDFATRAGAVRVTFKFWRDFDHRTATRVSVRRPGTRPFRLKPDPGYIFFVPEDRKKIHVGIIDRSNKPVVWVDQEPVEIIGDRDIEKPVIYRWDGARWRSLHPPKRLRDYMEVSNYGDLSQVAGGLLFWDSIFDLEDCFACPQPYRVSRLWVHGNHLTLHVLGTTRRRYQPDGPKNGYFVTPDTDPLREFGFIWKDRGRAVPLRHRKGHS